VSGFRALCGAELCFPRITPANAAALLLLSWFRPVAVWRVEVPRRLVGRLRLLRPYQAFSRDEWLRAHDEAFLAWRDQVLPSLRNSCVLSDRYRGASLDFSGNLQQQMGSEFERLYLFLAMLAQPGSAAAGTCAVLPRFARLLPPHVLHALFPDLRMARYGWHDLLDAVQDWGLSAAHVGLLLMRLGRRLFAPARDVAPCRVFWTGISPQEMASADDRLDFSWVARFGLLDAREVLFFPPVAPVDRQAEHLRRHGIRWLGPADMVGVLPPAARLRCAGAALAGVARGLLADQAGIGLYRARFMARAPLWDELVLRCGATHYLTTTSYSWPEKPELAVMRARAVRSVIWAYSANSLLTSVADSEFRDLGVQRSLVLADEFWVWNEAYALWLEKRQAVPGASVCTRTVGPLMCGDPGWLARPSWAARHRLGLPEEGVCLGVFDVPTVSDVWRDRFGGGPGMFDLACYDMFFGSVRAVLDRHPSCFALIKLKRRMGDPFREFPDSLRELVDENGPFVGQRRVFVIDPDIDPYLPVAASDMTMGMTYTSPVLAGLAIGRPGVYFDPPARANYPSSPGLRELTVQSLDELLAFVSGVIDNSRPFTIPADRSVIPPIPTFPEL
jgi:hypothetical protein